MGGPKNLHFDTVWIVPLKSEKFLNFSETSKLFQKTFSNCFEIGAKVPLFRQFETTNFDQNRGSFSSGRWNSSVEVWKFPWNFWNLRYLFKVCMKLFRNLSNDRLNLEKFKSRVWGLKPVKPENSFSKNIPLPLPSTPHPLPLPPLPPPPPPLTDGPTGRSMSRWAEGCAKGHARK